MTEKVSLAEFEQIYESVKNWGRWGPDDQLGTLNYITPEHVRRAAGLVRSGRRVSMEIPINTVAGPDNPNPAIHFVSQGHDIDIGSGGLRFGLDFLGMACHGDCHTHVDALCHVSYNGLTYNGKPRREVLTSQGRDRARHRRVRERASSGEACCSTSRASAASKWLEPGEAVTARRARGLRAGARASTRRGRHPRLPHRPPSRAGSSWGRGTTARRGEGKAGLHVDTIPWMHERRIAAFLPDGDGEAVPSTVEGMHVPDPRAPDRGDGNARLGQPPVRGPGRGLRGGGPLRVHGGRAAAPPAGRHRLAVEPDRDLLAQDRCVRGRRTG